jgi:hypothetical protein
MALYEVYLSATICVVADDLSEAEYTAEMEASSLDHWSAFGREITDVEEVDADWRDAIPFGGDVFSDATVRQILEAEPESESPTEKEFQAALEANGQKRLDLGKAP